MKQLTLTDEQYADLMEILPGATVTTTMALMETRVMPLLAVLRSPTELSETATESKTTELLRKIDTLLSKFDGGKGVAGGE